MIHGAALWFNHPWALEYFEISSQWRVLPRKRDIRWALYRGRSRSSWKNESVFETQKWSREGKRKRRMWAYEIIGALLSPKSDISTVLIRAHHLLDAHGRRGGKRGTDTQFSNFPLQNRVNKSVAVTRITMPRFRRIFKLMDWPTKSVEKIEAQILRKEENRSRRNNQRRL